MIKYDIRIYKFHATILNYQLNNIIWPIKIKSNLIIFDKQIIQNKGKIKKSRWKLKSKINVFLVYLILETWYDNIENIK